MAIPNETFKKKFIFHFNSKIYFLIFAASNFILAYSHLNLQIKLWFGLLGLGLPFISALKASRLPQPNEIPAIETEPFEGFTAWIWVPLLVLGFVLRFYQLVKLPVWPMWDDATNSYFGINQSQHWRWQFWYGEENVPFLFFWILALFFKLFPPSLWSLWFFPAVQSILLLPLGYWACRQFFPKTFSIFFLLILSLSFWPLFLGRFCIPAILMVLWLFIAFGLMGLALKSFKTRHRNIYALLLGFGVGVGFFTWIVALIPIILITTAMGASCTREGKKNHLAFLFFLVPLSLEALLAMNGIYPNIAQGHASHYFFSPGPGAFGLSQFQVSLSYLTVFLWGTLDKSYFNFGPLWGGYFNPLLGAAFLLGLVELFRYKGRAAFYWAIGSFLACLLPGLLSNTLEMMRVLTVLPFCVALVVLGLLKFLASFSKTQRLAVFVLVLAGSLSLDVYHLWGPYHEWSVPSAHSLDSKSPEHYQAFQILDKVQKKEGPGLILTEFVPNIFDQSLLVSTYPFNAARNPKLDSTKVHWAAVLSDASFEPYLIRRFPRSEIYPLSEGLPSNENDGLILFFLSLDNQTRPVVQNWLEAHRQIQDLFGLMPYHIPHPSYDKAIELLESCRGAFGADTFLQSCYLEKLHGLLHERDETRDQAIQALKENIQECALDPTLLLRKVFLLKKLAADYQMNHDDSHLIEVFSLALQSGYKSADFFRQWAQIEINRKDFRKALWAVQYSEKLFPEIPPPLGLVQWLQRQVVREQKQTAPIRPRDE